MAEHKETLTFYLLKALKTPLCSQFPTLPQEFPQKTVCADNYSNCISAKYSNEDNGVDLKRTVIRKEVNQVEAYFYLAPTDFT